MSSDMKIAVITGGAQGIGKAISKRLKESGCKVIIIDVVEDTARKTAELMYGMNQAYLQQLTRLLKNTTK